MKKEKIRSIKLNTGQTRFIYDSLETALLDLKDADSTKLMDAIKKRKPYKMHYWEYAKRSSEVTRTRDMVKLEQAVKRMPVELGNIDLSYAANKVNYLKHHIQQGEKLHIAEVGYVKAVKKYPYYVLTIHPKGYKECFCYMDVIGYESRLDHDN